MRIDYVTVAYIPVKDSQFLDSLERSYSHWKIRGNKLHINSEELLDYLDIEEDEKDKDIHSFIMSVVNELRDGTGDIIFYRFR